MPKWINSRARKIDMHKFYYGTIITLIVVLFIITLTSCGSASHKPYDPSEPVTTFSEEYGGEVNRMCSDDGLAFAILEPWSKQLAMARVPEWDEACQ